MSDKISLPFANMRAIARDMLVETDNLINETESRHQQILSAKAQLPALMQGGFDNFLDPFHRNLQQVLALRQSIGKTLSSAADAAEQAEAAIDPGFQSR